MTPDAASDHTGRGPGTAHRRWLFRRPTFGGLAVALLFWWWSLQPSMLPRTRSAQGAVSGLSAAVGYLLGTLAGYGVAALLRRLGREPTRRAGRLGWLVLGIVAAVVVAAGLGQWTGWQNEQRDLVGMEHLSPAVLAPMVGVTLVVFGVLFLVGRLVGHGIVAFDRLLARRMPRLAAHVITAAVFVAAGVLVTRDVVVDGFLDWANRRFAAVDTTTAAGVVAPTTPAVSGSPASLAPWATLGEYGRTFVAQATTPAELRAFHGPEADVREPIRVYAGLRSAGSADERAALAVRELERTGAFQREVLAVVTTTGTGWVDPDAASAIEYLHAGDTALVGLQYSYLPSWISFLVDRDEAAEAGTALYRQVHRRWSQLPAGSRPKLIIFGESLGSFGAEAAFRGARRRGVAGQPRRRVGRRPVHRAHRDQPHLGPAHRRPGAGLARLAPGLRRRHRRPVRQPARRPGAPRPVLAAAARPVRAPPLGPGRQRHPGGALAAAGMDRAPQGLRHPRPGRLGPDRHRAPGGGRPDRRLQRPLRLRPQLRRRLRQPAGRPSCPPRDGQTADTTRLQRHLPPE